MVTGAARSIGNAIAIAYAGEGASVCCAARTEAEIDETESEIERLDGRGLAVQTDVTQFESVRRAFAVAADSLVGVDILVANASGNLDRSRVEDGDPADWVATLELNLTGVNHCAKVAIPYLKQRCNEKIIATGSDIGHQGSADKTEYASSNAGLWMLTWVLAQELWEYNISVNELVPGPVLTERMREAYARREGSGFNIESEWVKGPEDVAQLALFLLTQSDKGPTAQSLSLMRRDT